MSQTVIEAIDAANAADPNRVKHAGQALAKESLYSMRMTDMLNRFNPQADELMHIAARDNILNAGALLAVTSLWVSKVIINGALLYMIFMPSV